MSHISANGFDAGVNQAKKKSEVMGHPGCLVSGLNTRQRRDSHSRLNHECSVGVFSVCWSSTTPSDTLSLATVIGTQMSHFCIMCD